MGKFMRNNRRGQVAAVVEGCLGVRTRAKTCWARKLSVFMDSEGKSSLDHHIDVENSNSLTEMLLDEENEDAQEAGNPTGTQEASSENGEEWNSKQVQDFPAANSQQETSCNRSTCVQQEPAEEEEELDRVSKARSAGSQLLRESHSDSCLDSRLGRTIPCAAHSRSNSDSFTHLNVAQEHEIEASYGDNALVLSATREKSQESNVCHEGLSMTTTDQGGAASAAPTPGSTSRLPEHPRHHHLHRTDCGWRHTPTVDEIEDFFTGVEDKDDRRRFIDKYNFDVLNDVPLPGRFEWVQFQQ